MVGQRASLSGLIQKRLGLNTASNIIRNSWLAFRMPGVHFVAVKACDLRTYQRSGGLSNNALHLTGALTGCLRTQVNASVRRPSRPQ